MPEIVLDSTALGLIQDSILFCENDDIKSLTALVQENPLLYKVISQVLKEWTHTTTGNNSKEQLSPASYFLNPHRHLNEPNGQRNQQPAFNIMPQRITNEDFQRALARTSRQQPAVPAAAAAATPSPSQLSSTTTRRQTINMEHLRSALQNAATITTPMDTTASTTGGFQAVPTNEPVTTAGVNVQLLLNQMHDMGLIDDEKNIRALEASGYDLQAAVDLILDS